MKGPACVITVGFTIALVERLESLVPVMPKHVHSVDGTKETYQKFQKHFRRQSFKSNYIVHATSLPSLFSAPASYCTKARGNPLHAAQALLSVGTLYSAVSISAILAANLVTGLLEARA